MLKNLIGVIYNISVTYNNIGKQLKSAPRWHKVPKSGQAVKTTVGKVAHKAGIRIQTPRLLSLVPMFFATSLLASPLLLSPTPTAQVTDNSEQNLQQSLLACRQEKSALIRLDCYDNMLKTVPLSSEKISFSETVVKIISQEMQRADHSSQFIVRQLGDEQQEVILTAPALGATPPRPILALSCIDKITRMQLIFFEPLSSSNSRLTLKTNTGTTIASHWFIRDNAYVLESSRGLPGIEEIQQLFNAETLKIESTNSTLNGLSFNISGLAQSVAPLRQACRW